MSYSNEGATPDSGETPVTCGFYKGSDVWFAFEMPLSGHARVDLVNTGDGNTSYQLYSGTCGALTQLLPEPGEGPDKAAREAGHFQIQLLGRHPDRSSCNLRLRIRADRDPGSRVRSAASVAAACRVRTGMGTDPAER